MRAFKYLLTFAIVTIALPNLFAQCQFIDDGGLPTNAPIYLGCSQRSATDTLLPITITPANAFGPYTITWGDGTMQSGASLTPPATLSHTYVSVSNNGTVVADTFFFTFTSGACTVNGMVLSGYPVTANIGVPGGLTQLVCAPGELVFINNSNGQSILPVIPGTTFTWDFGDGSPLLVLDETNVGDTVRHTYQRNTVDCITQVDLTADNRCNLQPSVNSQSPVLIYDLDDAAINASAVLLCYPDTVVDFTNGSMMNCLPEGNTQQRYALWNFGDYWGVGSDSIVGWRRSVTPFQDLPNPLTIAYPGVGTYVVNMIDSNMCGQEPATITIQIVDPPTAAFTISDDTICEGETVTFTNNTMGGANRFRWNFGEGAGFQALGGGNQTHQFNNAGTYTVSLAIGITGADCNDTVSMPIVVLPTPVAEIVLDTAIGCDSLNVVFSDNSTGAPPPIDWRWDFGNGNIDSVQNPAGSQFYTGPNSFNVSLTVTNIEGCTNTDNETVDVFQTPVPGFTVTQVCAGEVATFTDTSTFAPGDPILIYNWNFGDGSALSNLQNPTHTYATSGTFDVYLDVVTANCMGTDTVPIVVEDLPVADFVMDIDSGCSPLNVTFTNNSSVNAVSALWDFGDGNTSTDLNPTHIFTNSGINDTTYTVQLIAFTGFGCPDTIVQEVDVYPIPTAAFTSDAVVDCGPLLVNYTNTSSTNAIGFEWDFGDGDNSILENPSDTFENKTTFIQMYTVQLVVTSTNGCTDTTSQNFTVYPEPIFDFNITPDTGCSPLRVNFPSVIGAVIYDWDFGDGTFGAGPTPTHIYTNNTNKDTTYTVRLIAESPFGCSDTTFGDVKVFPNPTAQFTVNTNAGCPDLDVTFTNSSTNAASFSWDFDNGTTYDTTDLVVDQTFTNTTTLPQTYRVKMIATSDRGCLDSLEQDITVNAPVLAAFTGDTVGCSPFEANFQNQSGPAATIFEWNFGDGGGSTLENPFHGYLNTGNTPLNFVVTLIASSGSGCSDTVTAPISIFPAPRADFIVVPLEQTYPDTTIELENTTVGGMAWDYKWDFGDGETSDQFGPRFNHEYSTRQGNNNYVSGTFPVSLIASAAECADTIQKTVVINPPMPIPDFAPDSGCAPLIVQFNNDSKFGIQYLWDFNDGFTSTEAEPRHLFLEHGNYTVELKVFGEAGDVSLQKIIKVYESPQAAFFVQPTRVFIPGNPIVAFNSSVGDNLKYFWDFGDGTTSNVEDPQHFYKEEGEYDIQLIVDNGLCPDTLLRGSAVTAIPGGSIRTPNAFTPNAGGPSNGGRYDPTATNNDIFFPLVDNAVEIEFSIFNKWGELLFFSKELDVGWDGYYRGELCKQDVYVWKIKAKLIDESEVIRVGDLTLIR